MTTLDEHGEWPYGDHPDYPNTDAMPAARAALVSIREDVREARDLLISDKLDDCDEILARIELASIGGLA